MYNKKYLSLLAVTGFAAGLATAAPVFADTDNNNGFGRGFNQERRQSGVFGKVTAISGTNIIVTGSRDNKTYTVDAAGATITKNGATSTISDIAIGDMVMIRGTVSDKNIVATYVDDSVAGKGKGLKNQTPIINGDGQPMIVGTVSAINGSSISVTNKGNVTYIIDASSATIKKGGTENATISNIAVGDNVVAQGAVNGISMKASSVIDQGVPTAATTNPVGSNPATHPGFFGDIFNFFKHLFGF